MWSVIMKECVVVPDAALMEERAEEIEREVINVRH
jgi:hypothetical protein